MLLLIPQYDPSHSTFSPFSFMLTFMQCLHHTVCTRTGKPWKGVDDQTFWGTLGGSSKMTVQFQASLWSLIGCS